MADTPPPDHDPDSPGPRFEWQDPPAPGATHPPQPGAYPPPPSGGWEAPPVAPFEPPVPQPPAPHQPPTPYPTNQPNQPASTQPPPPNPAYAQPGHGQVPPPPPSGGWAPPPPPRKSSTKKLLITLAVIGGVLALGVGACSVWFVSTVKAPVDESNRFLAAIDQRDYGAAVAMSDPACNQGMTTADIEALFQGRDITYDLKNSQIVNSSATVSGSFSMQGQPFDYVEVSLRNDDGWQVCGVFVSDR